MTYAFTPAPRRGESEASAAVPDLTDETVADLLRAADEVACAHPGVDTACMGDSTCGRPGMITLVTDGGTALMCGLHAMAAVFSTPDLIALVKPDGT